MQVLVKEIIMVFEKKSFDMETFIPNISTTIIIISCLCHWYYKITYHAMHKLIEEAYLPKMWNTIMKLIELTISVGVHLRQRNGI